MVKKTGLLKQLDAHKGRDYEAEKKKKEHKTGEKRKRDKTEAADSLESDIETEKPKKVRSSKPGNTNGEANTPATNGTIPQPAEDAESSGSGPEDEESDVPLSDLEPEDLEDTIPHQRLTINNGPALLASTKRVTVAKPSLPFHTHNSLVSILAPVSESIPDPNDDITRELEFYRIARDAVVSARTQLKKEKVPFTRPADYFAEMVKNEEHMGKVKRKMYDEAAGKKASEEAKKLRDAKKFGKQVQVAKEQERAREKKTMLDNVKELKKRRKGQTATSTVEGDDLFQEIAVEHDSDSQPNKRQRRDTDGGSRGGRGGRGGGSNGVKRSDRDAKYGYGGKKRFAKSGDAMSSADLSGFSTRKMKGASSGSRGRGGGSGRGGRGGGGAKRTVQRPGKARRANARS